jgi:hypothetical protein
MDLNEYMEIFCGLVEPFPRLRTFENYIPPFPGAKFTEDMRDEMLQLTRLERDYYKERFKKARDFISSNVKFGEDQNGST